MEMEAALPCAKRTRRASPEANPPELAAAASGEASGWGSPVEPEQSRGQEPAPPGAEGDGSGDGAPDRISGLPDAILGEVLSLLSTKEAARTQVLSSRWRHIWRAAPLVLDATDLEAKGCPANKQEVDAIKEALAGAVSRILSAHPGPCRRFCVQPCHLYDRRATVDAWLRSPALDNLQELDFFRCQGRRYWWLWRCPWNQLAPPLASTFRFCATLHVATFSNFQLLDDTVEALQFPKLTHLALVEVRITEGSLHNMISSCPALECLLLDNSFGFGCLRVSCSRLRSIAVNANLSCNEPKLQKLVIVDAPCLERLLYLHDCVILHVSVISAPKLVTLGCLSDLGGSWLCETVVGTTTIKGLHVNMMIEVPWIKILAVKSWNLTLDMVIDLMKCFPCLEKLYIKGLRAENLTSVVRNVKILAVNLQFYDLDKVIDLMKCFPCLEKLYMKSCQSAFENFWRRKHRLFIKGSDIRIKTVVLENYWGINGQVNFASFFILNAKELEFLRLEVDIKNYNDLFFAQQHVALQMEKRASSGARLDFTTHRCHNNLLPIKHVCDLSIADPFQCRC